MRVEIRYPKATVGASGMRLFINDMFIPRVKEIKMEPPIVEVPTEGVRRTDLGCEIQCKGIELIDDGTGLIATIIRKEEECI